MSNLSKEKQEEVLANFEKEAAAKEAYQKNVQDFTKELNELCAKYDVQLVIQGQDVFQAIQAAASAAQAQKIIVLPAEKKIANPEELN